MTLLELLEKTSDFFEKKEIPSPRLNAELMLAHVLGLKRMELYLQFEDRMSDSVLDEFRPMVKRRAMREPLQYIIGSTDFYGLNIVCKEKVLIPRPETEVLVEHILNDFKRSDEVTFYDIGTGSGAIALTLGKELPKASVIGRDISDDALALSQENLRSLELTNVSFEKGNLLEGVTPDSARAVVANLPYLTDKEMSELQKEVTHEPELALHGGDDGLDLVHELVPQAIEVAPSLYLELGIGHIPEAVALLKEAGYSKVETHQDLSERERFVIGHR